MAEFFPPVIFEVKAKATEAIAEFGKVNTELAKMEKNGVLAGGALGKMEKAGKLAGTAFLGLAGAVGVFAVTSVKHLMSVQEAQTKLEVAIKNTGVSFDAAKPYIDKADSAMQDLGFSTQDTYDALAKMTAASGSPKLALDSLSATADLARAKNMSLADAGTLVARASIGQAKGLGDLGIALGKTLPKGASFAQVLKAIEDRYGGLAQKSKKDLTVQLEVLKAKFGALQVQVGTAVLPAFEKLANWLTITLIPALKDLFNWANKNKPILVALGVALAAIWAVPKVTAIISALSALGDAYVGLAGKAAAAATAEAAATGEAIGTAAVATGGVVAGLAGAASVGIAAAAGYGFYEAGTSQAKPTMPKVGGKGGGAAMALYQKQLAAWQAKQAKPMPSPKSVGSAGIKGKGVARYDSAQGAKKLSVKAQEKGVVGGSLNIQLGYNPHPSTVNAITGNTR